MASTLGNLGNHLGNAGLQRGSFRVRLVLALDQSFCLTNKIKSNTIKDCSFLKPLQWKKKHQNYNLTWETADRGLQTDTIYLVYLYPTTAITAKISNAHAFIYLQNPIMPVALWAKVPFIHITVAANKIRHHSWEGICDCVRANLLWMVLGYSSIRNNG